ncbi:MAG TPA: Rieske 2Fe-2S domain-containing protein [Terriglobales bacterium]|jgi:cytochrome b6-f complex iron-sulfur subunit|nr:Rieske 2Fe-2S domain-containing protein [Terriglobales bacterium]
MADESAKGILGRLPPLPRAALNNSVIGMEQAYRQRKGLPLLSDADVEALKAGQPMAWEVGGAAPAAPLPVAPVATAPAAPVAAAPSVAASGNISAEVAGWVAKGNKWSKSTIAAEQARRGRKGLPALNDFEIAALLGEAPAAAPVAAPAAASVAAAPVAVVAGNISAEVAGWVAQGKKWSKSTIAAEQARRSRKGLPALNDAEIAALLGEPAAAAPVAAAPVAAAAAPRAAAPAMAASAAASVARSGTSTSYVGTPAVGTSKAAAAGGVAAIGPEDNEINRARRRLVWATVAAFLTAWLLAFFRFFLPRTLFEPATSFKIGYPEEYGLGVDTKFQQKYRIWVDRTPDRIFVIYARCTHLGCTPDWKPSENKFKCPCHGSGYDSEGVNFEGPAPRPMDRAHIETAPDGQILVDVSRLYQWPKGQPSQFNDDGAFLRA